MENGVSICTKRRFSECFAKVVLETYFNDRYCDLLLSDKPDLFDEKNKIGVEVVEAVDEREREAQTLWVEMPKKTAQQQERAKERMKQLGEEYQGGIQSWSSVEYPYNLENSPLQIVIRGMKGKIKKLLKYTECEKYDLFIFSCLYIQEEMMPKLFAKLKELNCGEKTFSVVFLYGQKTMVKFNFETDNYVISKDKNQFEISERANQLLKYGENNV